MVSFFKKLAKLFEFSKLKYRFVFFFLIASLIPTLIIGISSYLISKELIIEKEVKAAMVNISKLKDEINVALSERETTALSFCIDPAVQRQFSKSEDNNDNKYQIMALLVAGQHMKGNHSIFVSDEYGNIYSNVRAVSFISKSMTYEYSRFLQNNNIDYKWVGLDRIQGEYILPYVRAIESLDMKRKLGLVIINLRESTIFNIYKNLLKELNADIYILDENGIIISNQNKKYLGSSFSNICSLQKETGFKSNYMEATINGEKFLLIELNDYKTNWKYVCLISLEYMLAGTKSINRITVLICFLTALLSLVVGITVTSKITVPINKLITFMDTVDGGNLDLEYNIDRKDEIGKFANFFNKMIKKLKVSIDEIYHVQKAKRDAELKALVFQINPHFLYNTLSSIIWLAHNGKNDNVIEMADALSKLFRISISKGQEFITVSKEIEHVQSYIAIQMIRYKNKFVCAFDIEDDILNYYTPKLILQPLVENSIYHGIKNLDTKGIIKIEGKKVNDTIVFNIIDNGNAMTEKEIDNLNHILLDCVEESDFGIGVKNVNNRIRLYFGADYGLKYKKEGNNIVASVTIPILESDSYTG